MTQPSAAVERARDLIRTERLTEVLLTYADSGDKITAIHRLALKGHRELSQALHSGLKDGHWPWTKETFSSTPPAVQGDLK